MFKDPGNILPPETTETPIEGEGAECPNALKPWEDQSLSPEERLESYAAFVHQKLEAIRVTFDRARELKDVTTQKEIMNSPETKQWMDEGTWLQSATAEEFCERTDRAMVRALLGKNFLGAEAWKAQGIDVGEVPPIPKAITKSLLESDCALHPGEKIKDTHLLVLVPKTVNGEPYSALKLDELCATGKGSGNKLIDDRADWAIAWKEQSWASAPQAESEWILIPKSDPDPNKVTADKHFRFKKIAAQHQVHNTHYKEYREVKTVELITAVLLNDLVNGEPRILNGLNYLRCAELNAAGARVCVGYFFDGLEILGDCEEIADETFGRALARRW